MENTKTIDLQDVINRAKSGENVLTIAAHYKVGAASIYKILKSYREGVALPATIQVKTNARPKITNKHHSYLKKTVVNKSPRDLGIVQEAGKYGWSEYEIQELLKSQFKVKIALNDCREQLRLLNVPIGEHSITPNITSTEKRLRKLSKEFNNWLDTHGAAQLKRENMAAERLITEKKNAKPLVIRTSKFLKEPWVDVYYDLILIDPLCKNAKDLSRSLLKMIK